VRILKATLPASSPGLLRQPLSDDSNVDSNVSLHVSEVFRLYIENLPFN